MSPPPIAAWAGFSARRADRPARGAVLRLILAASPSACSVPAAHLSREGPGARGVNAHGDEPSAAACDAACDGVASSSRPAVPHRGRRRGRRRRLDEVGRTQLTRRSGSNGSDSSEPLRALHARGAGSHRVTAFMGPSRAEGSTSATRSARRAPGEKKVEAPPVEVGRAFSSRRGGTAAVAVSCRGTEGKASGPGVEPRRRTTPRAESPARRDGASRRPVDGLGREA